MLTPGELSVGMYITVSDLKKEKAEEPNFFNNEIRIVQKTDNAGHWAKGAILKVKALCLPYIAVKKITDHIYTTGTHSLDTRQYDFMELTKEYIKAFVPNYTI